MTTDGKRYSVQECILAIRSNPESQYGFKDDDVFKILLNTEISSEEDIDKLLKEVLFFRKNLINKFCAEFSKKRR